jgi:hypothetical protein
MTYTIFAYRDGSLIVESKTKKKRQLFEDGAIAVVSLETVEQVARVLSTYATCVNDTWYLKAALDGPFDSINVFYDLVQTIRREFETATYF